MRVMNGMGHPAHVHFFKNTIWEPEKKGYQVKVTARGSASRLPASALPGGPSGAGGMGERRSS